MEYREFHGQKISRLGMGTMRLPRIGGKDGAPIDYEAAEQVIDCAYDNGITYYDTAWPYHEGTSESFVGKALVSRHPRDTFALATKFNYRANPDYRYVFETQLERLQTDYIDFYLMHAVMDNSIDNYLSCGCIDYFLEQKEKGRISYLGFSNHAEPEVLARVTEPFYRADKARSRTGGHAGLGLALVKRIVALHDGALSFVSAPGKGTTVTVRLHVPKEERV